MMQKYNCQYYLKSAVEIANMLDKLPKLPGWTTNEYKTIKKLLIKGFYSNLKTAKEYVYSDYEEDDNGK